jgi:hypothetical protein
MQLPGRLGITTLGDLLGRLHRARASGALELVAGGRHHRVHLHRGLVSGIELEVTTLPAPIGDVLVRDGLAARGEVDRVLARKVLLGIDAPLFGDMLVRAGVVSGEIRDAALRKQTRARLDALFALLEGRDAEIRFHVGVSIGRRSVQHMIAPLTAREFLYGRTRARAKKHLADNDGSPIPPPTRLTRERIDALRMLGLSDDASPEEIRRAFRVAASRVHPDRHQTAPAWERARLEAQFAELSAAYHTLCA